MDFQPIPILIYSRHSHNENPILTCVVLHESAGSNLSHSIYNSEGEKLICVPLWNIWSHICNNLAWKTFNCIIQSHMHNHRYRYPKTSLHNLKWRHFFLFSKLVHRHQSVLFLINYMQRNIGLQSRLKLRICEVSSNLLFLMPSKQKKVEEKIHIMKEKPHPYALLPLSISSMSMQLGCLWVHHQIIFKVQ